MKDFLITTEVPLYSDELMHDILNGVNKTIVVPGLLAIGIDPGKGTTGIFVVDIRTQQVIFTKTCKYLDALQHIDRFPPEQVAAVVIEDPGLNDFAYSRNVKGNPAKDMKLQRNAGVNQQVAHFLIETLRQRGYLVRQVRPTPEARKWKVHLYTAVTGDSSKVSQHVRDAARMVAGMSAQQLRNIPPPPPPRKRQRKVKAEAI